MEIRFTLSVMEAINMVLRLVSGRLSIIPKSTNPQTAEDLERAYIRVEPPVWCNFDFFGRIKAAPVRRTSRREPSREHVGSWRLEREVEFYHHNGNLVAVVHLIGEKYDGSANCDNEAMWAVDQLRYAMTSSGIINEGIRSPLGWRQVDIKVIGLSGRLVK